MAVRGGATSRMYQRIGLSAVAHLPGGPRGYHALRVVATGEPRSQLAMAQRLGIDKTVMTYLLDDLEGAKLVTRRPDPADRRARQVTITAKGRAALTRARTGLRKAEAALLHGLSAEEQQTLRGLLSRTARDETAGASSDCASPEPKAPPGSTRR